MVNTPQLRALEQLRAEFPGLSPEVASLDGAAGTQVPRAVIEAISAALGTAMSNTHGAFAASQVSSGVESAARSAVADLVGGSADGVILGPNMTTLTFHLADALAQTWRAGDEIVVTSLDHDANIRPWVLAAQRAGVTVRTAHLDPESGELPVAAVTRLLGERTRLVAVTAASNLLGTRPDVAAISAAAHAVGARTFVDGVHASAHVPIDVSALGADFYACSSYKYCGPHTGAVIADPALLEELTPLKLVPSSNAVPHRFERGTPAFELLAGVRAAVDWLAGLTDAEGDRRSRLRASFGATEVRLHGLLDRLLEGLEGIDGVRLLGRPRQRTPTVSFTLAGRRPDTVAHSLAANNIAVWSGDNYAYELINRLGLRESGGAIRVSLVLYSTQDEVDRLLAAVADLARG